MTGVGTRDHGIDVTKAKGSAKIRGRGVTRLSAPPLGKKGRAHLTLRVDFGGYGALGPGKIMLLEFIDRYGSIAAAGRRMDMSYRRAWLLVDSINAMFGDTAVRRQRGGRGGGGSAVLTKLGRKIVSHYRDIEREAEAAVGHRLKNLQRALASKPPPDPTAKLRT
jgi:molybdate transport system regulatory protein